METVGQKEEKECQERSLAVKATVGKCATITTIKEAVPTIPFFRRRHKEADSNWVRQKQKA